MGAEKPERQETLPISHVTGLREVPCSFAGHVVLVAVPLPNRPSLQPDRWMIVFRQTAEESTSPDRVFGVSHIARPIPFGRWFAVQSNCDLTLVEALALCAERAHREGAR